MQSRKTPRIEPERLRRPRGLVQEIVETLAANLREGMIKAGDKLPTESEIMLRFDVSRTVGGQGFHDLLHQATWPAQALGLGPRGFP